MARLVDMEQDLKNTIEEYGVKDSIVFNKIYDLCHEYLKRGKKMNTPAETEETAMILAEDLYLKIYKGGHIHSWCGYISVAAIAAIRKYRKMTSSEIWDITNDTKLEETIITACSSGSLSLNESNYSNIFNEDCIHRIYEYIEEILDKCCRYYRDTSDWNNLFLSILLSLANGFPVFILIKKTEQQYAKMMLSIVQNRLAENFRIECDDTRLSGRDSIALFTLGEVSE